MGLLALSIRLLAQDADSLLNVVRALPDNAEKLEAIDKMCHVHPNVDTIEKYARIEHDLASKLQIIEYKADAHDNLSWVSHCRHDFVEAMNHRMEAIQIWDSLGRERDLAFSYMNYATTLMSIKSYILADEYYQKSFELFTRLSDSAYMSRVFQYLGILNIGNLAYDNADEFYQSALDIDMKINDKRGVAYDFSGLGHSALERFHDHYSDTNIALLRHAKHLMIKSYHIADSINDISMQLYSVPKLSEIYIYESKLDVARSRQLLDSSLYYYKLGTKISDDYGYDFAYIGLQIPYINYLMQKKLYGKAREVIDQTISTIRSRPDGESQLSALYQTLIDFNAATGNYAEAYRYSQRQYSDLLAENSKNNQYKLTQTRFITEYTAKLNERVIAERERELTHKIKESNQRRIIVSILFGFFLVSGLAVLFLVSTIKRKRMNAVLAAAQQNLIEQNHLINEANHKIISGIRYARHIQDVAMPNIELMNSIFGDCMVIFRPRDIVSGDFYWATQIGRYKALAVADCTGHGVPGALLSILGISMLNDLVASSNMHGPEVSPARLLNTLRTKMRESLRQKSDDYTNQDGMDIAMCIYDTQAKCVQYAGAFRPLLLVRRGELIQYEADRMPIGTQMNVDKPFTNNIIDVEDDDVIYLYTDGVTDQFNAEEDAMKFTAPRLRELIMANQHLNLNQQKLVFEHTFDEWRTSPQTGEMVHQTDDMLLVGVKFG
ncbi:MAG: SpoIIE family protein phosphatase [Salinivirgaceae bacterium]|nr:SpoIIE family protein phosphatase [Salinivirgaceae bacterium]